MESQSDSLRHELEALGANLRQAVEAVWQSEERQRLQADLEAGLEQALSTVRSELSDFSESDTGQRLRSDVKRFQDELESGEAVDQLRQSLASVLHGINEELRQAAAAKPSAPPAGDSPKEQTES